jgi:two-component system, OmpR family, phosphate regulon sensor histidine kinase PhoR
MGTISIIGIIVMQIYWVKKAFDLNERTFNQTINIALKNVADKIAMFNHSALPPENPVNELSSDYYVVNVNTIIDASVLEHYLKEAFLSVNMNLDYEYAIYDCATNKMVYGKYVSPLKHEEKKDPAPNLPVYNKYTYYFVIHFPTKTTMIAGKMDIWIYSSAILLIVITFFGYAMYIILKQSRLSEIQKDFVNNMTHEFKTPLSTISVSTDVLSNPEITEAPDTLFNYVNIIRQENNRLIGQVEKLLQVANLDMNRVKLHPEKIALHEVLANAIDKMRLGFKNKKIIITPHFGAVNDNILADKVHVSNIIYNLLDNAIKYSPEIAEIDVYTSNAGKHLVVVIADKGIGIGKAEQKKVFDKFYRVHTGNLHNVKGFGLGLHYVKNVVKAHRWSITLESEPGKGSTFTFKMPVINE